MLELIVVLAVIAALATLLIPRLSVSTDDVNDTVLEKEMADIQTAFMRFAADCVPTDTQLEDIAQYGLWPLFSSTHPDGGSDYPAYDTTKTTGWRGAYAMQEGARDVNPAAVGQPSGATSVPVLLDPHGGYYRVFMPNAGAGRQRRLALVSTGRNKTLETTDVPVGGLIQAGGDDQVLRLLPLAP
jgi:type II secretory pathway pseudopilin PulG